MTEYQPRTAERLIEILRAQDENPRSWQSEAAAMIEQLRMHLSAAGINLVTASIVVKKLGHPDEAAPFDKAADAVLQALGAAHT